MKYKNYFLNFIGYFILVSTPFLLLFILSFVWGRNVFNGIPYASDEISYWRQVYNFKDYLWNGGYIGLDENFSPIGSFGTHGFFPVFFYYPYSKIFGWNYNSIMLANATFMSLCFLIYILIRKPKIIQSIYLSLLYMLYFPIIKYSSTMMTQVINYGFLIVFFLSFYYYYKAEDERRKKKFFILTIIIGSVFSMYRYGYYILLILPVLKENNFKLSKKLILELIILIFYCLSLFLIFNLFKAPYPYNKLNQILNAGSISLTFQMLISNFLFNLSKFFDPLNGVPYEVIQRYFYIIMMILYLFLILFEIKVRKENKIKLSIQKRESFDKIHLIQFILLFLPFILCLLIYNVFSFRDYRTLAPFLWSTFLLPFIFNYKNNQKYMSIIFIAFFLVNMQYFSMIKFDDGRYNFSPTKSIDIINQYVVYDPEADNQFDNTMLTDTFTFDLWARVNSGIGLQYIYRIDLSRDFEDLKSKYILIKNLMDIPGYSLVNQTDYGYLYIRDD